MNIAIIGAGHIGGNLGQLLAKAGHSVAFASRNPGKLDDLVARTEGQARATTPEDAIAKADVVIEALPYAAAMALDPQALAGKTLVSASNYYPDRDGQLDLGGMGETEALAARLPETRVVKAFNMLYYKELEDRLTGGGTPGAAMALAGDDGDARRVASGLIRDAGFEPVDAGDLERGRSFQSDGPLYAKAMSERDMRAALAEQRAA